MKQYTQASYNVCELCPRTCHAKRREKQTGVCGQTDDIRIARAALHFWEEPPISGEKGSGTIFFSGCPLGCIFCQNRSISAEGFGKVVSIDRLAHIMLELQEQGAHNINLVTALHFAPSVYEAICQAKKQGLVIPIVCNTSGYERKELISYMADVVDIWLTDFKYASSDLAKRYSYASDYPQVCLEALKTMLEVTRPRSLDDQGLMRSGIIVRHLLMPGCQQDSYRVLDMLYETCGIDAVDVSLMNQYTPNEICQKRDDALSQTITQDAYERVLTYADDLGFKHIWWQQEGTVSQSFIPAFDTTGVEKSAAAYK